MTVVSVSLRDTSAIDDVRADLARWCDAAMAGEMDGDEMLSRIGDIAEQLDEAIMGLRRALGW